MLRVLHVVCSMGSGGAEAMIMNLYRRIDRSKVQFDFLVHTEDPAFYDEEIEEMGGRIHRLTKCNGANSFSYYRDCCHFFEGHPEYTIVHGHLGSSAAIYLSVAKRYGCYTIAHSHSASESISFHSIAYRIFSYPTRFISNQLFGCSQKAGDSRFGYRLAHSAKYQNFHNAVDLKKFQYCEKGREVFRNELHIGDGIKLFGAIGRLTEQKNPFYTLDIFEEITRKTPQSLCVMVGAGDLSESLRQSIEERGLAQKVLLLGVRSDITNILSALDCLVMPSLWEGFPVALVEAQATGVPCVISDEITDEVCLTDCINMLSLKDQPDTWAELCLSCAEKSLGHRKSRNQELKRAGYDIDDVAEELQKFYLNI